jgi:nitric oxide reductase subunit C
MAKKTKNIIYNQLIIGILLFFFAMYNIVIYRDATFVKKRVLSDMAIQGQQIWQDNNCTACHQFYGLGGYLGPDLTNVISDTLKGENYIRKMINAGVNAMPKYHFSEPEINQLIAYFKAIDQTGFFPNRKIQESHFGWIEVTQK